MDVFALKQHLIGDYSRFARSFTTIRADDLGQGVEQEYASGRFWPEPLIQINPRYSLGRTTAELVAAAELHPVTAKHFPIGLYRHQEQAVAFAGQGESFVVTTGTGSGKSLCFFLPIVDAVLRAKEQDSTSRTRAIVIYPMNALANSQREELIKYLGENGPVTFARYTGQEDQDERERIKNNPPDILLTNFMMLEMLMTRQSELDTQVIRNCEGLQFLVLDELHTYRGRQGADVAMLVRRVRERMAPERLQCIGTSATMASGGTREDQNTQVAEVASTLFATTIPAFNVVTEDLDRATDPARTAESVAGELTAAINAGIRPDISDADLRDNSVFRSERDAELTKKLYRAAPVLIDEGRADGNPWGIRFMTMFHMSNDSHLFADAPDAGRLPLYEAKLIHQFDHRWATYVDADKTRDVLTSEKADPDLVVTPRYWVDGSEVRERLAGKGWENGWLTGWRRNARSTDDRTTIATVMTRVGAGDSLFLYLTGSAFGAAESAALLGALNSLSLDFVARQKVGGMNYSFYYFRQLPVLPPDSYSEADLAFIVPRVLELTYTAHDLASWARDLGYDGPPFAFDPARRAILRAELDAYYARLYGLTRDELRYVLDPADVMGADYPSETFRVLKNNEQREFGEYRTRRLVLEAWDKLQSGALQ